MSKNDYKVHGTSIIGKSVKIGSGTKIWQFCNIMDNVEIGENCNIGQNVFIETGVKIGNRVTIKNNVALYTGVICEDDVFFGPSCVLTNVLTPRSFVSRKNEFKNTIIHRGGVLGANCTIVCGHSIGQYAMVGAGAVVTRDVSDYALVVGNPAKAIGYVCKCGERIYINQNELYVCSRCKRKYCVQNEKLIEL